MQKCYVEQEIQAAAEQLLARPSFRELLETVLKVPEHRRDAIMEKSIHELQRKVCFKEIEAGKIEWLNSGDGSSENIICWVTGADRVEADFTQRRIITQIKKLAERNPEDVVIHWINKDGSINCSFPVEYVSIRKPKQMNYSEEQREVLRERMKAIKSKDTVHEK